MQEDWTVFECRRHGRRRKDPGGKNREEKEKDLVIVSVSSSIVLVSTMQAFSLVALLLGVSLSGKKTVA